MEKSMPRLPRAEPFHLEGFISPYARIDAAIDELKRAAQESDALVFVTPLFSVPCHPAPTIRRMPTPMPSAAPHFHRAALGAASAALTALCVGGLMTLAIAAKENMDGNIVRETARQLVFSPLSILR